MRRRTMSPRQIAMLLALAAAWGASFLFIAIAVPAFGAIGVADARVLLAAAVLAAVAVWRGALPRLRERPRAWLILGTVNVAIPFTLISAAQLTIPASLAAIVNATTPMWAVLVGGVALGERVGTITVAGLVAGVAGVALVVGLAPVEPDLRTLASVGAVALAGLGYAIGSHFAKRRFSGVAPATMAIGQLFTAGVVLLPVLALVGPRETPDGGQVAAIVALAVPCTAVAYLLYFRLIAEVGVNSTLTVTYLVPVFGVLWAALFRGERITLGMVAGTALVFAGVALVSRGGRPSPAPTSAAATEPPADRTTDTNRPRV
jgi:drug/metabolite transporter (DMT)-like permease